MEFDAFFERATGQTPYPYQQRLAGEPQLPEVLVAPTGAGKTAAVTLAWLYRRRFSSKEIRQATPRRLVWCLPMRTLVSQTSEVARRWLTAHDLLDEGRELKRRTGVSVHVLMGGATDEDWRLHPEQDGVLVGTQDMLLSRALNRGYAASRFAWPWEFALLSNDCLWVFDEVQLMGVGLATGLQLAALRGALGSYGPSGSLFMSATLEPSWLRTVDHPDAGSVLTLSKDDLRAPELKQRRHAVKRLERADTRRSKGFERQLAAEVLRRHLRGTRTLVVLNTVDSATAAAEAMRKRSAGGVAVVLVHSRFRPPDREAALRVATAAEFDGIVVSTQVVEAGVDISSRTLFTDLAPWPALVQRAGRCNRGGEYEDASVLWVDHEPLDDHSAPPYEVAELEHARTHLRRLDSFNHQAIEDAGVELAAPSPSHVLRRKDVIDLFDTTPDLAGIDLDVARFIRDGDERDAQVFWRDVGNAPASDLPRPAREELCSVPFFQLRRFVADHPAWRWDHLDGKWCPVKDREILPGVVYLLDVRAGGYSPQAGWDPGSRDPVVPIETSPGTPPEEAQDSDELSYLERWVTLRQHSQDARDAAREIVDALAWPQLPATTVVRAAQAHDLGKAHEVFQNTMRRGYEGDPGSELWAKSGTRARHERRGFRHELASALAWLAHGDGQDRDLVAYLLAAHHGKVRLILRALPTDEKPTGDRLHARGVFDQDRLPAVDLGDGLALPETVLDLSPMLLGSTHGVPSWAERMLALRDSLGPFRLALLEALVRAADVRATMRERKVHP